jgi:pSer/pThr/pTyr-binding forkhead associated (FHA) protein
MADSRTRKLERPPGSEGRDRFFARYRAALVLLSGPAAGNEYALDSERISVGRGPDAELTLDDSSMSRTHAVFEFAESGFRVRDLGSTNGVLLNGHAVQTAELKHGDRIQLGESTLQFILEERSASPRTYVLPEG